MVKHKYGIIVVKMFYQKNTNLPSYLTALKTMSNMLKYNNITDSFISLGKLFVNKMQMMLIFPGVKRYNVFTEYIFSSQFLIKNNLNQDKLQKVKIFI